MRFWLAIALLLILVTAAVAYARLPGNRESGIFDTNPPTPYFHYRPTGTLRGQVLVVHGLDCSRDIMNILSFGLADAGFEVFSIDLPGHGESRSGFNAIQARNVVGSVLDRLGQETAVLGHSFGGGVLLDLSGDRPMGRMVLFSPAPIPLQTVQAEHVLVLVGQFDPGRLRAWVPQIESSATGTFEFRDLAWTGHSGGLFRANVIASVAKWLGGDATAIHTTRRLVLLALILLSSIALGVTLLPSWPGGVAVPQRKYREASEAGTDGVVVQDRTENSAHLPILYYTIASLAAAGVLALVNVAAWLRIFAMDYLIGFFFLAGLILLSRCKGLTLKKSPRLWIGVTAAAYLIVVTGSLGASELAHTVASGGRWWRFLAILIVSLPMFLADEYLLRPIQPARKAAGAAIVTRILIGAIAVSGALILNRQSAFLLLIAYLVVLFWIGLWFAAGAVRKRTDPFTAACFAAIVQAWAFAAFFVMV